MKNIDIKSLIIGALLTSTIFLGVAATGTTDKWDQKQERIIIDDDEAKRIGVSSEDQGGGGGDKYTIKGGWEPFATYGKYAGDVLYRKRIK